MSGYNRQEKTFTLTAVKMEHYHRNHPHAAFSRKICPICNAQYGQEYMEVVAVFFRSNGFDVVDVGDAHITISAPSKPRKKFGMWITKETDALYQLLAGRIEPQPGSLPPVFNFNGNEAPVFSEANIVISSENDSPLAQLRSWLKELTEQKQSELQQAQRQSKQYREQENMRQTRPIIIVRQTELALITLIQTKIQEFMEKKDDKAELQE